MIKRSGCCGAWHDMWFYGCGFGLVVGLYSVVQCRSKLGCGVRCSVGAVRGLHSVVLGQG